MRILSLKEFMEPDFTLYENKLINPNLVKVKTLQIYL